MGKVKKKPMHPRNVFRTLPDYTKLAIKYKDFRMVCQLQLNGKVYVDFKNEAALRALSQTLLQEYFQLKVDFAPGSLVPTVPLRLNYILWIEDLVAELKLEQVKGIDIGCGSSCIYALLAARKNGWHMSALEANSVNLEYAQKNVDENGLQDLIKIFPQSDKQSIFKDFFETLPADETFQFCLCNPPFYDSNLADPFHSTTRNPEKRPAPHNCPTGHADELVCEGGEVEFVQRIIEESLKHPERVCIFTSMLGLKSSLSKVTDILKSHNIASFCTTEFCQGKTTRWGVAWSLIKDINLCKNE